METYALKNDIDSVNSRKKVSASRGNLHSSQARYFNPLIFLADTLRVFYRGAYHEPFTYDNSETSPHRLP
jgi:hypothetical protein